ncbi:MAG: TonB-dependent receptor [Pseudomonadota bacterium]
MTKTSMRSGTALSLAFSGLLPVCTWAETATPVDIASQDMIDAIAELGVATGRQITGPGELLAGRTSVAIRGSMTPRDSLATMLGDDSLSVSELSDGTLVVSQNRLNFVSQNATDAPLDLGSIILRGPLIDTPLQENRDSVVVVTGEELEERGDNDIYDVIERTPGVIVSDQERGFGIRGVDQRGIGNSNTGLAVSTQVDGVALTNAATFDGPYSVWDLEQVEIYRGPQGTQQGRAAQAGAIILRSADPTFSQEFRLRGEIGQFDTYGGAFVANVPLVEDRLAFRLSAESTRTDGFVDNNTRGEDDFNERERDTVRAKLRWDPTSNFSSILSFSYTDSKRGGQELVAGFYPSGFISLNDIDEVENNEHLIYGLRLNWDINPSLRLESETSFLDFDATRLQDLNGATAGAFAQVNQFSEVFEQDLRLIYESDAVDAVVGLFYTDISQSRNILFDAGGGPATFSVSSDNENYAIFGEATIAADGILPGLSAVVGARYDTETVRNFDVAISGATTNTRTTFDAFLPKVGLIYDWTDRISTSFIYQRSYRPGASQLNARTGQVNEVGPEFADNFEIAFRGEFLDDRLTVNANIFQTDYTDLQLLQFDPADPTRLSQNLVNAGEARARGVELQVEARPSSTWLVYGSTAYLDTEFKDFAGTTVARDGQQFAGAPEWSALLGFEYYATYKVTLAADMTYQDDSFLNVPNNPTNLSEERFLVNARVTYDDGPFSAGLYVRNLFDETYRLNSQRTIVGEPRTVGAFVEYTF